MPELPEVETVRRSLEPVVSGRRITGCRISWHRLPGHPSLESFTALLSGRRITGIHRRGKYLLLATDPPGWWVVHLRMTGRLQYVADSKALASEELHRHAVVRLSGGGGLAWQDVRKFGRWYLLPPGPFRREAGAPPGLANLGPEPLSEAFSPDYLLETMQGRKRSLKSLLLDQSLIAGLGNIYVDEALHRAGLPPRRPAGAAERRDVVRLHGVIRQVLTEAVAEGGTSFRDYRDGRGRPGEFVQKLQVYGREGKPCRTCKTPIVREVISGRGTAYCPSCQPAQR